jgi:anaerobic magnesium-protoporphyrin IX monomethyl ester cyclase
VAKKEGLRVKFIDMIEDGVGVDELLDFIDKTNPSLVGFSAFTKQICAVGKISTKIKRKVHDVMICVGGCHASAMPLQTLEEFPDIDFVFSGEVEEQLLNIFSCLNDHHALVRLPGVVTRDSKNISSVFIKDLDRIPFPAWEEFDLAKYPGNLPHRTKRELPMITTRGCPYKCTFCCRSNGDKIRYRSVKSVISEIERNIEEFGCEAIAFYDDNFIMDKRRTEQLFYELNRLGLNKKIKWGCSMRVDNASPDLMKNMRKAGCFYVYFGFESANDDTLERIQKRTSVSQMLQAVKAAKQAGIVPVGSFMIGLPGDTKEDIYKAIALGKELDLYSITFPIAVPYPGTVMREQALKNMYGMRILSNDWDYYGRKTIDSAEDFEILESDDLTARMRKELQEFAYSQHPKKKWDEYLQQLERFDA